MSIEGNICMKTVHCADFDCTGEIDGGADFEEPICMHCGALYTTRLCDVVATGEYDKERVGR